MLDRVSERSHDMVLMGERRMFDEPLCGVLPMLFSWTEICARSSLTLVWRESWPSG